MEVEDQRTDISREAMVEAGEMAQVVKMDRMARTVRIAEMEEVAEEAVE